MPNRRMAEVIATKLREGLIWPGDGERQPMAIPLPAFTSQAGMPEEYNTLVTQTGIMVGEAIIAAIEEQGVELVDNDQMHRIRAIEDRDARGEGARTIPVHCRCDQNFKDPLMYLTYNDGPHIIIDGSHLLRGLQGRSVKHPHDRSR